MVAIFIGFLSMFILQVAVWEVVVLGIAYGVHLLSGADVPYVLIGSIVFGVWFVILVIYGSLFYWGYKNMEGN